MRAAIGFVFWASTCSFAWAGACALDAAGAPAAAVSFRGVARGPATKEEIATQTAVAVKRAGAPMSPKYADLPRAYVYYEAGGARHGTIAAVVDGVMPKPGEKVALLSRRRDPDVPCAFIPWTITRGAPLKPTT